MLLNDSEHRTFSKFKVAIYIGDNKETDLLDILEKKTPIIKQADP